MLPTALPQLNTEGYLILRQLLPPMQVAALVAQMETLWQAEGDAAGSENYMEADTRRLANLADKGIVFREIYRHPTIRAVVAAVMGWEMRVSMLNARDAPPHGGRVQPLHCDTDSSGKPDEKGYYACTILCMLDDFTVENGATRLVPGTHLSGLVPKEVLADMYAPHPDEIIATGKAGDVLVFNGHCWHAGRPNTTDRHRRALLIHFLRADIPRERADRRQQISPTVEATLTPLDREVLGLDD